MSVTSTKPKRTEMCTNKNKLLFSQGQSNVCACNKSVIDFGTENTKVFEQAKMQ